MGLDAKTLSAKSYPAFKKALQESDCKACALHKGRTQIVVDRGNPKANIFMVGEGPGEKEDLQGQAFVGRSGKMLDTMCSEAGINTAEDVIIGNVVRCRPPDNRAPKTEEAQTCISYLYKQIKLVKPKVIVLLGRTALLHLLPEHKKAAVRDIVGTFLKSETHPDWSFFMCYHPAYILRDPRKKPQMVEMLKKVRSYT